MSDAANGTPFGFAPSRRAPRTESGEVPETARVLTIVPRARRVHLVIPVMYRRPGDDVWFSSRVVNLSESGVLFGPAELQPGSQVEVMLSPPIPIGNLATGKQVFEAEVVRTTEAGAVAAHFGECRFLLEA